MPHACNAVGGYAMVVGSSSRPIRAGLAQRARMVFLAAEGVPHTKIAERIKLPPKTVTALEGPLRESSLAGLADQPRSGRLARSTERRFHRDVNGSAEEAGRDPLVEPDVGRAARGRSRHGRASVGGVRSCAVALRDI